MAKPIARETPPTLPLPTSFPAIPSAALLALLGPLLAASPRAAASPAPPPFLCPSIYSSPSTAPPSPTIHPRSLLPRPPSPHRRSPFSTRGRNLPLRYEPGEDGVWRRVQTYTLYGSTICTQPCQLPTGALGPNDVSDLDASNLTESVKIHDTLPAGWLSSTDNSENRTILIFALSLVLAVFVCFFIVGCLFWRKNRRHRRKRRDLEMRRKKSRPEPSQSLIDARKEAKERQKFWARATARWRQNALYTARKRRGRRPTSPRSQPRASSSLIHISSPPDPPSADDVSSALSRQTLSDTHTVSPRSSIESHVSSLSSPQEVADSSLSPLPNSSSSPPAYRQRTLAGPSAHHHSDAHLVSDEYNSPDSLIPPSPHPPHLSPDSSPTGEKSPLSANGSQTPRAPIHAAHVATDDKTLLARLADLAERPPGEVMRAAKPSHQVSVPVWMDEEFEDFPQSSGTDASNSASQLPYPPPPAKGKMAESSFYAYRGSFEEFSESIDPEAGPCAPPFETLDRPSLGDIVLLPSAPPLVGEDFLPEVSDDGEFQDSPQTSDRSQECPSSTVSHPLNDGNLPGYRP